MSADREQAIAEKEAQIATLEAEIERLKVVLPEPPVDAVVFTTGLEDYGPSIYFRQTEGKERDWTQLVGPIRGMQSTRRNGAHTTWLAITETYPDIFVAKWEKLVASE